MIRRMTVGESMKAFAIGLLLACLANDADAGSSIIGAGSQTCTAWISAKRIRSSKELESSWLDFLNIRGERDMVTAWTDQRCLTTPSDRIGIAALDLGMELAKRAAKQ
jgi:hypothetical protein